jgi:hypothetical protein
MVEAIFKPTKFRLTDDRDLRVTERFTEGTMRFAATHDEGNRLVGPLVLVDHGRLPYR